MKFGIKNASEVYGVIFMGFGIGSLLGPIVAKFVIHTLTDFMVIFFIGGGAALISLFLSVVFLDVTPYDYNAKFSQMIKQ